MSARAGATGAVEGLRARVERRASQGVWFGYRTGHGYGLKAWAAKGRPRAHLARADELVHGKGGSFAKGVHALGGRPAARGCYVKGWIVGDR